MNRLFLSIAAIFLIGCGGGSDTKSSIDKDWRHFSSTKIETLSSLKNNTQNVLTYELTNITANHCDLAYNSIITIGDLITYSSTPENFIAELTGQQITLNDILLNPSLYRFIIDPTSKKYIKTELYYPYQCYTDSIKITYNVIYDTTENIKDTKSYTILNPQYDQSNVYSEKNSDPLYKYQWHLKNTGQNFGIVAATEGEDINVEPVWDEGITGKGVTVGVIDTGVDMFHPDLKDNIDWENSYNYHNGKNNPTPSGESGTDEAHATAVAGIIAAKGWNGIGTRGVAPNAKIASLNALEVDDNEVSELGYSSLYLKKVRLLDALTRNLDSIDIYNNSWSGDERSLLDDVNASLMGIGANEFDTQTDYGVKFGRNGLGAIYIKGAGNGDLDSNANFNQAATNGNWIVVGALGADGKVASYSTPGSVILVSAPGGESNPIYTKENELMIVTTDLAGDKRGYDIEDRLATIQPHFDVKGNENYDYTNRMIGTSAAAPIVSGVVALMLEANPNLTYRDIQIILAKTARKNDPDDRDWQTNAAGLHFNYKYGFGAVDAKAAVEMAKNWQSVGGFNELKKISYSVYPLMESNQSIITYPIKIDENIKVENVMLTLSIENEQNETILNPVWSDSGTNEKSYTQTLTSGTKLIQADTNGSFTIYFHKPYAPDVTKVTLNPPEGFTSTSQIFELDENTTYEVKIVPENNSTRWSFTLFDVQNLQSSPTSQIGIYLKSPSGTVSTLVKPYNSLDFNDTYNNTRLLTTNFMGENSEGNWTIILKGNGRFNLLNAKLTLTGH